ncbi:MAG: fatty acid desaturase [Myxococcota bacterium]
MSDLHPRPGGPPHGPLARLALHLVRDERDLPLLRLGVLAILILGPGMAIMYALPTSWTLALTPVWLAVVFLGFGGRYLLMVHAVIHRPLFRPELRWLEHLFPSIVAIPFGCTPNSFYTHHVGMHHAEGNMEDDHSSTLGYRRDSFPQFVHYWARFFFFGYLHVPRYFKIRERRKLYLQLVMGEYTWGLLVLVGLYFDWAATFVTLVLPFCLIRWFMMCGNFAQHAFVDVDHADDPYRNSTVLLNTTYNRKCWNDGYHIVHHIKPNLHWSEMPAWFEAHRETFAEHDAIVFDGIQNNQQIWWLLMTHNYGKLADHLVDFKGRTREERIAFLQSRTQRQGMAMRGFLEREPDLRAAPAV